MWVHYGYGYNGSSLSANRISGYSKGCLNFQNYQGQAGYFQTLHKLKEGSKLIGNNGNTFLCNETSSEGTHTWSKKSRNFPWGKIMTSSAASNNAQGYNFHMMLLSQLKKPSGFSGSGGGGSW